MAELQAVDQPQWWDTATPEQIGRSYQVARTWEQEDPAAARAVGTVREQVRERYGIDVEDAGADPEQVRQLPRLELDRAERDRVAAEAARTRAAREDTEAATLLSHAAHEDHAAEQARAVAATDPSPAKRERATAAAESHQASANAAHAEAAPAYDSAERRAGTAKELEAAATTVRSKTPGARHSSLATARHRSLRTLQLSGASWSRTPHRVRPGGHHQPPRTDCQ